VVGGPRWQTLASISRSNMEEIELSIINVARRGNNRRDIHSPQTDVLYITNLLHIMQTQFVTLQYIRFQL
jgi:hypothetical protein